MKIKRQRNEERRVKRLAKKLIAEKEQRDSKKLLMTDLDCVGDIDSCKASTETIKNAT